jgi:carbon-monoxide dehydrogenase medium subunit
MQGNAMRYEAPSSLEQAVALLSAESGDARVLAGGTDLLVQLKTDLIDPVLVVDIKHIEETREIREEDGGFRVGAAVTGAELKEHPKLKSVWPGIVEAANLIGSTQIQGRATMGGNLCNGSPAADSVPALIAAGAKALVVGHNGRREVAIEDVMIAPRKLSLAKGEIIASFLLPAKPARTGEAYLRFIPRTEMDIAVVGCGVCLTVDAGGTCTAARVALGAVAARPLLVADAAAALIGTKVDDAALAKLDAAAAAACRPIDDKRGTKEYRVKVAGVLARRAAQIALERARKS